MLYLKGTAAILKPHLPLLPLMLLVLCRMIGFGIRFRDDLTFSIRIRQESAKDMMLVHDAESE